MKLATAINEIQTNIDGQSHSATIELNAITFQALSSTIYKNPIKAIMRELLCNAKDSHAEAGNTDPIHVILPSTLHPQLVIQDFGLGMDHETVFSVFTNYFSSTKRESETLTGGFGLGSKTPYAYTNQFTVESTFNKVCRTYALYKDETGQPEGTLVQTRITPDKNGVKITIPVKDRDFYEFCHAAIAVATHLGHGITGITVPPTKYEGEYHFDDVTALIQPNCYYPLIIQGGVAYPAINNRYMGLHLVVPPGTFKPTLSREALETTPDQIKIYDNLIDKALLNIQETLEATMAREDNIYDALKIYHAAPIMPHTIKWRDIDLQDNIKILGYARLYRRPNRVAITASSQCLRRKPSIIYTGNKEFNYKKTPTPINYNEWHLHLWGDTNEQLEILGYKNIPIVSTEKLKTKSTRKASTKRQITGHFARHSTNSLEPIRTGEDIILSRHTPILDTVRQLFPETPAPYILMPANFHEWTQKTLLKTGAYATENEYLKTHPIAKNTIAQVIAFHNRKHNISTNLLDRCKSLPGVDMKLLTHTLYVGRRNVDALLPLTTEREIAEETKKLAPRMDDLARKITAMEHKLSLSHGNYAQYILENT